MRERFGTLILLVLVSLSSNPSPSPTACRSPSGPSYIALRVSPVLYSLWWLYFEDTDDAYEDKTANPALWIYTHLPLSLALIAFGVAVKKLLESVYAQHLNPSLRLHVLRHAGDVLFGAGGAESVGARKWEGSSVPTPVWAQPPCSPSLTSLASAL